MADSIDMWIVLDIIFFFSGVVNWFFMKMLFPDPSKKSPSYAWILEFFERELYRCLNS